MVLQNTIFDIRYIRIHFILEILEDTILPKDKVSAFRGGIGEMLLRCNCIRNRDCDHCDFETECIVRRIMYAKAKITPKSVTKGESFGYLFECENKEEEFFAGDRIDLKLILFGQNIVYFNQYLQALSMLGMQGIGKNESKFRICEIYEKQDQPIMDGYNILMQNYRVETLHSYVQYRIRQLEKEFRGEIQFYSPTTLKSGGELLTEFRLDAIYKAAWRRLYMLNCFEGNEMDETECLEELPFQIVSQRVCQETVIRYSNHKRQRMYLNGMTGSVKLEETGSLESKEAFLQVLLAGEILHIGKNTSFGFGRYRIR